MKDEHKIKSDSSLCPVSQLICPAPFWLNLITFFFSEAISHKRKKDGILGMMLVTSSPHQSAQTLLSHSTSVDNAAVILKMANSIEDMSLSGDSGLPVAVVSSGAVGLQHKTSATRENDFHSTTRGCDRMSLGEQVLPMRAPHISTLYEKQDVMTKHFGVTQEQALRTQALLRLGVTDEDVRIAERLMGPRSAGDNVSLYCHLLPDSYVLLLAFCVRTFYRREAGIDRKVHTLCTTVPDDISCRRDGANDTA